MLGPHQIGLTGQTEQCLVQINVRLQQQNILHEGDVDVEKFQRKTEKILLIINNNKKKLVYASRKAESSTWLIKQSMSIYFFVSIFSKTSFFKLFSSGSNTLYHEKEKVVEHIFKYELSQRIPAH